MIQCPRCLRLVTEKDLVMIEQGDKLVNGEKVKQEDTIITKLLSNLYTKKKVIICKFCVKEYNEKEEKK